MLNLTIPVLIPFVVMGITMGIMFLVLQLWLGKIRKRNRRSPLTRNMLRSPGETLREQIDELETENTFVLVMTFMAPFLIYSVTLSQICFSSEPNLTAAWVAFFLITSLGLIFSLRRVIGNLEQLRRYRLGMEGEIATGEELNQLMLYGCRVFHDLPFEYGNIDHVVISQSGVFSVETKAIAKLNEAESHKVTVDFQNNMIRFSDVNWRMPVDQVETNSRWLGQYLSSATGMKITAKPMLALPGYFIEKLIGKSKCFVFNPKNPKTIFCHSRVVFTPDEVQKIAHQVEQLCRDVKPSFSKPKSKTV